MSSLLSVLLVASSSSGSRLLFAYPPNATATIRVQRPLYGKSAGVREAQSRSDDNLAYSVFNADAEQASAEGARSHSRLASNDLEDGEEEDEDGEDMFGSRFIRGECSSSSSSEDEDVDGHWHSDQYYTRETRERETYKTHLGIDVAVLGSLLCPPKELCDKRFEMVINHLAFITHPVTANRRKKRRVSLPPSTRHASGVSSMVTAVRGTDDLSSPFSSDDEEVAAGNGESKEGFGTASVRRMQTSVDDISGPGRGRSGPASAMHSRRSSRSQPPASIRASNITNTAVNQKTSRQNSISRIDHASYRGGLQAGHGEPGTTKHKASNLSFTSYSNEDSLPSLLPGAVTEGNSGTSNAIPPSPAHSSATLPKSDLDTYAVVLVIDSPPDQHLSYHLGVYYRDVIVPVMSALKIEDRRTGYMASECAKISSLRDKALDHGTPLTPHIQHLVAASDLCGQLAKLYHDVKSTGISTLLFNDIIEQSVLLHTDLFSDSRFSTTLDTSANLATRSSLYAQARSHDLRRRQLATPYDTHRLDLARLTSRLTDGVLEGQMPSMLHIENIMPWQTLLPLQDPGDMLKQIEGHTSQLISRFVELMSPSLTFSEYETLLDTDSENIIAIAEHFVKYRQAKVIDAISLKSIYIPHRPQKPGRTKLLAEWTHDFGILFTELPPLPSLLAVLSTPQPFESIVPSGSRFRHVYLDALTWLLQQDLVIQLRVCINLVATPEIKRSAWDRENGAGQIGKARGKAQRSSQASDGSDLDDNRERELDEDDDDDGSSPIANRHTKPGDSGISAGSNGTSDNRSGSDKNGSGLSLRSSGFASSTDGDGGMEAASSLGTISRHEGGSFNSGNQVSGSSSNSTGGYRTHGAQHRHLSGKASNKSESGRSTPRLAISTLSDPAKAAILKTLEYPSIIAHPSEPTTDEESWIAAIIRQVQRDKGKNSTPTFVRMLPYLDGTHHLDEILYRAGLTRKAVRSVLADFDAYLVSFVT